jgi:hypothetical protein
MYKFIFLIFAIALAMFTTGCTASYQHMTLNQPANELYPQSRFLLVTPVNGMYGNTVYPSSGFEVIQALTKELQHYTNAIATIPVPVTIEQIYPQDLAQTDYVIIPQILHWEDRATGWSFVPDRIEVRFDIYNNQRQLIDSYLINGRSAYIVWVSKQPNSLLPKPIRAMLKELFGKLK